MIRWCKACDARGLKSQYHDVSEWPAECYKDVRLVAGYHIIKDIEPYRAIATDVDGKRPAIMGRRQHREFLQRNGYREVGNDVPMKPKEAQYDLATQRDVKQAIDQLRNR